MQKPIVYLIPSLLDENAVHTIPAYVAGCVKNCQVFFVENERTARRFIKQLCKTYLPAHEMIIDNYEWFTDPQGRRGGRCCI